MYRDIECRTQGTLQFLINSHVFTMNLLKTLLYKVRNTYTLVDI